METHIENIKAYLLSGKAITKQEALFMFGCWNTGDVIHKLRREGHSIETEMILEKGKTFAQYKLITQ